MHSVAVNVWRECCFFAVLSSYSLLQLIFDFTLVEFSCHVSWTFLQFQSEAVIATVRNERDNWNIKIYYA